MQFAGVNPLGPSCTAAQFARNFAQPFAKIYARWAWCYLWLQAAVQRTNAAPSRRYVAIDSLMNARDSIAVRGPVLTVVHGNLTVSSSGQLVGSIHGKPQMYC